MSVPPQVIRVKRKATEEAPVSYLRVQENKRHRSDIFVYRRQEEEATFADNIPQQVQKPIIHTAQPRAQAPAAFQNDVKQNTDSSNTHNTAEDNGSADKQARVLFRASDANTKAAGPTSEPRCFHMSRRDMMLAGSPYPTRPNGGISKKRSAPALFVERRIKCLPSRNLERFQSAYNATLPAPSRPPAPAPAPPALPQDMEVDKPQPRKLKKPGVARLATESGDATTYKAKLSKAVTQGWNVDMERLAAEMDAYAMEQIGLNLKKAEHEKQKAIPANNRTTQLQSRFKPKPIARYAERHPEETQPSADSDMVDADVDTSDSDEGDYIIETYVRIPASKLGDGLPPQSVGLLVFDDEPDMEFFYGEGDDSDDEWAEDEEDENAENYYTADYPDEEVASDDEYNHNAYGFRTGNASDLEEYNVEDDESDDSPFGKRDESGNFKTYIGRNGLKTNHL